MMLAKRAQEWVLLGLIFIVAPTLFFVVVVLRGHKAMAAYKASQAAAEARLQTLVPVQPLSSEERSLLADPAAPWRTRIPCLDSDAARLWHYHQTVTQLQGAFQKCGVKTGAIRSSFDPVQGSFSLPALSGAGKEQLGAGVPQGRLQAWVLEVTVEGSPGQLFMALDALTQVDPILEPLALRWEATPKGPRQCLILRNLVLVP